MNAPELVICQDSDTLAARAVEFIVQGATEAVRERGGFSLVLSGGSTPHQTYALLAGPNRHAIDWQRTYVFFADERLVSPEDPRSNFRLARELLLSHVPLPPSHCFPIPTLGRSAAQAAAAYAEQLAQFFWDRGHPARLERGHVADRSAAEMAALPRFDLILLGLGEDGHVASLFPGADALHETHAWVTWSPAGSLPPHVDRVTLTYPVLNAARHVIFLVTGEQKAAALRDILDDGAPPERLPAAGVHPIEGTRTWLVDQQAAKLLSAPLRAELAGVPEALHQEKS